MTTRHVSVRMDVQVCDKLKEEAKEENMTMTDYTKAILIVGRFAMKGGVLSWIWATSRNLTQSMDRAERRMGEDLEDIYWRAKNES